jgi:hypothetical protein
MSTGLARAVEGVAGARPQDAVLGDQRPVEVAREGGDPLRESVREFDCYGTVPPVDVTT